MKHEVALSGSRATAAALAELNPPMRRMIPPDETASGYTALWSAVLVHALKEAPSAADARAYLRSKDGRTVLALTGLDPEVRLDMLDLAALEDGHARGPRIVSNAPWATPQEKTDDAVEARQPPVEATKSEPAPAAVPQRVPRQETMRDRVRAECGRLFADGVEPTLALLRAALPDLRPSSVAVELSKWRKTSGCAVPPRAVAALKAKLARARKARRSGKGEAS